ncbi:hypothetical protein KIN20_018200 [Parelaphostrongylus tenuis]|uniref:Uncharacterized protein n=1 Tax=Parelaphostrongylus tenuis TaxID=148309 RepID=A0AAD5QU71_PARTN|nr:hypothetical protein KIN20_018200 [Parelaphostrongylus tenuis]
MGQRLAPRLAIAFMSKVEAPVMDLRPTLYYFVQKSSTISVSYTVFDEVSISSDFKQWENVIHS